MTEQDMVKRLAARMQELLDEGEVNGKTFARNALDVLREQDMVDKVARTLDPGAWNPDPEDYAHDQAGLELRQDAARKHARDIFEAIRDPTDDLWDAGHAALEVHGDSHRAACWVWRAMIDKALGK